MCHCPWWLALAAVTVVWLQYSCLVGRRARVHEASRMLEQVEDMAIACASDDDACAQRARDWVRPASPCDDVRGFFGADSWACGLIMALPGLPGVFGDTVPSGGLVTVDARHTELDTWFARQCDCKWIPLLPRWANVVTGGNLADRPMVSEYVTHVSRAEVMRRAQSHHLFFAPRGPEFEAWLDDDTSESSEFYNEASARITERTRVAIVVRNVRVWRHRAVWSRWTTYTMAVNQYEMVAWSAGCACVPDRPSMEWALDHLMSVIRAKVNVAGSAALLAGSDVPQLACDAKG